MIRIYPLIFIILWSSAFVSTKPIIDKTGKIGENLSALNYILDV